MKLFAIFNRQTPKTNHVSKINISNSTTSVQKHENLNLQVHGSPFLKERNVFFSWPNNFIKSTSITQFSRNFHSTMPRLSQSSYRQKFVWFLEQKGRDPLANFLFGQDSLSEQNSVKEKFKKGWDVVAKLLIYPIQAPIELSMSNLKSKVKNNHGSIVFMSSYEKAFQDVITVLNKLESDFKQNEESRKSDQSDSSKQKEDIKKPSQSIAIIRNEFTKEFGKNLSIPYAYQKNSSEILDMEYERGMAKALGRYHVYLMIFVLIFLIGLGVDQWSQRRKENKKDLKAVQQEINELLKKLKVVYQKIDGAFHIQWFRSLEIEQLKDFTLTSQEISDLIENVEKLIKELNDVGLMFHSPWLTWLGTKVSTLYAQKDNLSKELKESKQELNIFRVLIRAILQREAEDYEKALESLKKIIPDIDRNQTPLDWKAIITRNQQIDDHAYAKDEYKYVDKKLLALAWCLRSTILLDEAGDLDDVDVIRVENDEEFKKQFDSWKESRANVLFVFLPASNTWESHLKKDDGKIIKETIDEKHPSFKKELDKVDQEDISSYDKNPLHDLLRKKTLFKDYVPLKDREKAFDDAIQAALVSEGIYSTPYALNNVSLAYAWGKQDYDASEEIDREVIERYPAFSIAYNDYADTLLYKGNLGTALEQVKKALFLDPKNTIIKCTKAQILQAKVEISESSEEKCRLHKEAVELLDSKEDKESIQRLKSEQEKDVYFTTLSFSKKYLRTHCPVEKDAKNSNSREMGTDNDGLKYNRK